MIYILLDQSLGELAAMRYVDYLEVFSAHTCTSSGVMSWPFIRRPKPLLRVRPTRIFHLSSSSLGARFWNIWTFWMPRRRGRP